VSTGTAPPAPPGGQRPEGPNNIATAVADVSERASALIREEIELAKAELTAKMTSLARGAVVGVAAGIFFVTALVFVLVGCAWLIYYLLPVNQWAYFFGFFAMAVILIILGAIAGLIAARVMKKGAPPVPTMAIDEAQKIREDLAGPDATGHYPVPPPATARNGTSGAAAPAPAAPPPPPATGGSQS